MSKAQRPAYEDWLFIRPTGNLLPVDLLTRTPGEAPWLVFIGPCPWDHSYWSLFPVARGNTYIGRCGLSINAKNKSLTSISHLTYCHSLPSMNEPLCL